MTRGWLGLLFRSHSPSHWTASTPTGFTLHNSTSPVTRTSWTDSEQLGIGDLIALSNSSPVALFLILLMPSIEDCNTEPDPWGNKSIDSIRLVRLGMFLTTPACASCDTNETYVMRRWEGINMSYTIWISYLRLRYGEQVFFAVDLVVRMDYQTGRLQVINTEQIQVLVLKLFTNSQQRHLVHCGRSVKSTIGQFWQLLEK